MQPQVPSELHPLVDAFVSAAAQVGLPRVADGYQSEELEGVGPFAFHVAKARRLSTAGAYLRPAQPTGTTRSLIVRALPPAG